MAELELDHGAALAELSALLTDGDEQHRRHQARTPALAPTAAGRAFVDRGAAIAAMLERLHTVGRERIDAVRTTAEAAHRQVGVFRDADLDFADSLRGQA